MIRRGFGVWGWIGLAVLGTGLSYAAMHDFAFSQAVYMPSLYFAVWMECFGWYPMAFGPVLLLALFPGRAVPGKRRLWCTACLTGLALLYGILLYSSYGYFLNRAALLGHPGVFWWTSVLLMFVPGLALPWMLAKLSEAAQRRVRLTGLAAGVLSLGQVVLVNVLKFIWARSRFDDLLAANAPEQFTPWYLPLGNGGTSFPSAHTANAACILVLVLLCELFPRLKRWRYAAYTACWTYILTMGLARIVIGRHYLSDTLVGMAIVALLFSIIHRSRWYARASAKAAGPPGCDREHG